MATSEAIKRLSESEYLSLERRAEFKSEFFAGELFAMAGGSPMHSLIAANVIRELGNKLKGSLCRAFTSDLRLKVQATGLLTYPDVSVFCGPLALAAGTDDTATNPTLLVEVLSDSTEAYDRGEKFRQYRQMPSLREYLLINQRLPRIEQFIQRDADGWMLRTAEDIVASLALPSLTIAIELKEVYSGVTFDPGPIRAHAPPVEKPKS